MFWCFYYFLLDGQAAAESGLHFRRRKFCKDWVGGVVSECSAQASGITYLEIAHILRRILWPFRNVRGQIRFKCEGIELLMKFNERARMARPLDRESTTIGERKTEREMEGERGLGSEFPWHRPDWGSAPQQTACWLDVATQPLGSAPPRAARRGSARLPPRRRCRRRRSAVDTVCKMQRGLPNRPARRRTRGPHRNPRGFDPRSQFEGSLFQSLSSAY